MLCSYTSPRYQVSVYRTIGPLVYVYCFTRPRYQVSVYRTIGPLVEFMTPAGAIWLSY